MNRALPADAPIVWGAMESALGRVYVAARAGGAVVRITYGIPEIQFLEELEGIPGRGEAVWDPEGVAPVLKQLEEYFEGTRREFELDVDLSELTPFDQSVLRVTRTIPYGETRSYGDVAAALGKPKGARAVGQALRRNPVGIVIPCHRVVAADGRLHGFSASGGLESKRFLLDLEGCRGTWRERG